MKSNSDDSVSMVSAKPRNQVTSTEGLSPNRCKVMKRNSGTLADHISNDRLRDHILDREKPTKTPSSGFSLTKQKSCREFKCLDNDGSSNGFKENDRPFIGGSMRYKGNFSFLGKSTPSSSSVKKHSSNDSCIVPGRLSMDENAVCKKSLSSSRRNSDSSMSCSVDTEPGCLSSPIITTASRKQGREVSSKYMSEVLRRVPRGTCDSDVSNPLSFDESLVMKKSIMQKGIRRANSLIGYMSSKSQWALSPGRSGSPPMCVESREKPLSFSSLRPPNKSMEKILSMGIDLFRTKKSSLRSGTMEFGNSEDVQRLRLLHNRLIQWRFANARAEAVNEHISHLTESNLIYALDGLIRLRHSVLQKKMQLEREKLEMKFNLLLRSQMKLLETWGGMERQHVAAINAAKECLHSVVCKVPLLEGAKVDIQSMSITQRHAFDISASIKSVLISFSSSADKTAELLCELAKVVAQEKLLLEEFYDIFQSICVLELKERSLKCSLIQLGC